MKEKMMATMLYGPGDLRLVEVNVPEVGPDEVLVEVMVDGLCPTGVNAIKKGTKWGPPDAPSLGFPGHEFSGVVVKVGKKVEHLKEGDRVVADLIIPCGRCSFCRSGRHNLCPNMSGLGYFSWAEYIKTLGTQTYKFSDGTRFEEAALTEPLSTVLHCIKRANIPPGGYLVVIGSGPMGLLHLQLAKRIAGARVIMLDLLDQRLKIAEKMGAYASLKPDKNLPEKIKELTDGNGANSVIVTVGSTTAQENAFDLVADGGTVVFFAGIHLLNTPMISINPNFIHYKEVDVRGAFDKTKEEFVRALKLIEQGVLNVDLLITHKFPLNEFKKAIEVYEKREGLKVMIYPQKR